MSNRIDHHLVKLAKKYQRDRVEVEYGRLYDRIGFGTTIWSPLASGLLTGKYNDGLPKHARLGLADYGWLRDWVLKPERLEKVRRFGKLAADLGLSQSVLAIAWCLKNPNVSTVILGASKLAQLQENLQASAVAEKLGPELLRRSTRSWEPSRRKLPTRITIRNSEGGI